MKYFRLIWKNVWRKKIRTSLTILSVFVAFLLFSLLSAFNFAFRGGVDVADAERLIVIHKVSLVNLLPMSYLNRIAATDGIAFVTHATWFGGYYQEPRNQFGQFPVDPDAYFAMYPEFNISTEQFEAFKRNRTGAVVGQELADRFGAIPDEVDNLLYQLRLKALAGRAGVEAITVEDGKLAVRCPRLETANRPGLQRRLGRGVRVSRRATWVPCDGVPSQRWQVVLVQVLEALAEI